MNDGSNPSGAIRTATAPRPRHDLVRLAVRWGPALLGAYLALVAFATLLGLGFDPALANAGWRLRRALAPDIGGKDLVDAVRNVALFLGWGATVVLTARLPATRRTVLVATLTGALASLTVESVQLFSVRRMASIVDVATNTLGAFVGSALLVALEQRARVDVRRGTLLGVPGWFAAGALALGCTGLAFMPTSRPTPTLSWAGSPFARLRETLAAAPASHDWGSYVPDAAAFALLGVLAVLAAADARGRPRAPQLVAWVVILALLVPGTAVLRGMAGLAADPRARDVHLIATTAGVALALVGGRRWAAACPDPARRCAQVALAAMAAGTLWTCWPAWWVRDGAGPGWWSLVPMGSLYQRQDLGSVFVVLQKVGPGALLGAALAGRRATGRDQPGLRAVALFAVALELVQLVVPGRTPDVTDVLMVVAGAATAATLALRGAAGGTGPAVPDAR